MAKCKKCGKKSSQLNADGLCNECVEKRRAQGIDVLDRLDDLLPALEVARAKLSFEQKTAKIRDEINRQAGLATNETEKSTEIEELEKTIATLETSITKEFNMHTVYLISRYRKLGEKEKAWELLSSFVIDATKHAIEVSKPFGQILLEIAKMLEGENNYLDAIGVYMLNMFHDQAVALIPYPTFEEQFSKNVEMCVSKLKWNEDIVDDLIALGADYIGLNPTTVMKNILVLYRDYIEMNKLETLAEVNDGIV